MVETFPNIILSYGSSRSGKQRIKEANFGDNYSQRIPDGINAIDESWSLVFQNRTKADVLQIEAFLDAGTGEEAFFWTPPDETASNPVKKWRLVGEYSRSLQASDIYSISFKIKRTYEL